MRSPASLHFWIEERRAHFQAHGHARSIHLREQVIGQVDELIRQHHSIEQVRWLAPVQNLLILIGIDSLLRDDIPRMLPGRQQRAVHVADRVGVHHMAKLEHPLAKVFRRHSRKDR